MPEHSILHNTPAQSSTDSNYRQCSLSVMDNIADPDITFDEQGICHYYHDFMHVKKSLGLDSEEARLAKMKQALTEIKAAGAGKQYNCIVGVSGGADSTYLAYFAKKEGLNPLIVHFDYGWNTELAVSNIENTVKRLNLDLLTYVMDWSEFKSLQRSYFKASVLDLDVPADHMIFGALFKTAKKFGIKYVLSGNNIWAEHTLPRTWNYNKFDLVNLRNIHKSFENTPLRHLPTLGLWQYAYYQLVQNIKSVQLLNYLKLNVAEIKDIISSELNWKDYGGKHNESVFTRFYQGYILPKKFLIDKRKAHLSNLIFSEQLTRAEALNILAEPPYSPDLQKDDLVYVAKKLDFSPGEFAEVLSLPNRPHEQYGTDRKQRELYFKIMKNIRPITGILKKLRK